MNTILRDVQYGFIVRPAGALRRRFRYPFARAARTRASLSSIVVVVVVVVVLRTSNPPPAPRRRVSTPLVTASP